MSMKTIETPRRVYHRNGVTHVCFSGNLWGPTEETQITPEMFVRCFVEEDGSCRVEHRKQGQKRIVENWRPVRVPSRPRAAK